MSAILLPGDKSISHRALMFSSLATGESTLENLSPSEDVKSTQSVLKDLGVSIKIKSTKVRVMGSGLFLKRPTKTLDCGNAGTLMRLMMGVLSGQKFYSELVGDESLSSRPMNRVSIPLAKMGAKIELSNGSFAPVKISQSYITGGNVEVQIASAQVKSALLLAGLYSQENDLVLRGLLKTRDHTERMLKYYGAEIEVENESITLRRNSKLISQNFLIPNDISAASFWFTYAILTQKKLELSNLLLTPSRMGFVNVLKKSGAKFKIRMTNEIPEVVGDIVFEPSHIRSFKVGAAEIPSLIDEIPVMCLLASQLEGESQILGAGELRVKESDRLFSTQRALESLGLKIHIKGDDITIPGGQKILGGTVDSFKDHRIAMTAGIASCFAKKDVEIINKEVAGISDPHFFDNFKKL